MLSGDTGRYFCTIQNNIREAKMDNPSFIYCYYAFCAHFGIFHKLNDIVRCSRSIYIVEWDQWLTNLQSTH